MTKDIDLWSGEWVPEEKSSEPWLYDVYIIKSIPYIVKAAEDIENKRLRWPEDLSKYVVTDKKQ